jgi:hypothetical protein
MKYRFFAAVLAVFTLVACHDHEDSATMKEAKKVHEGMIKLQAQLEETIGAKTSQIQGQLDSKLAEGDSLAATQLQSLREQIDTWHNALHQWEEEMVEIPGHAHTHADGEEHDHSSHAGTLEGLSDEEILAIQNELAKKLDSIKAGVEQLEIEE